MGSGKVLRRLAFIGAGFLLAVSPAIRAQAAPPSPVTKIAVGLNDSPPLSYLDDKGTPHGRVVRLATGLLARAGIPAAVGIYPAPRLFKSLQEGSVQFSIVVRAPILDACCLYSKDPVMQHTLRIYSLGNTPAVRSREELAGKSVIGLAGYSYGGMIHFLRDEKNHIRLEAAPGTHAAFQMLSSGRADYLLAYDANTLDYLAANPVPGLKSHIIAQVPIYLVLSRSYPEAAKVLAQLEILAKETQGPPK